MYQWLTTAPNPRSSSQGPDAGQRGWKLHAVEAKDTTTFGSLKGHAALCGMRPRHGWSLDMFIEDRCQRCERVLARKTVLAMTIQLETYHGACADLLMHDYGVPPRHRHAVLSAIQAIYDQRVLIHAQIVASVRGYSPLPHTQNLQTLLSSLSTHPPLFRRRCE